MMSAAPQGVRVGGSEEEGSADDVGGYTSTQIHITLYKYIDINVLAEGTPLAQDALARDEHARSALSLLG